MPTLKLTKKYAIYPEYKDSDVEWIGKMPRTWQIVPMRSVSEENNRKNDKGECQNLLSLSYGKIVEKDINSSEGLLPESFNTYQIVSRGNIVFRLTDLQNDKKSLRVGFVDHEQEGIITSAYMAIKMDGDIDNKFAYYLLHAYDLQKVYYGLGGGVRQGLDYSNFKYLPFLIPNSEEQKHIADYLDEKTALIDQTIQKKQKQIELLKEKRTAVINQAVTTGLDSHVELIESGTEWIGKIPKGWNVSKLKHISDIFGRIGFRGYTVEDIVGQDEGAISLSPSNIAENILITEDNTYISWEKYDESPEIKVFNGDILLVKTGSTIGKVAYCNENEKKMTINPQLVVLKNIKISNKYFYYFLTSQFFQDQMRAMIMGGSTPSLSQSKIGAYLVTYADIIDQEKIIIYLDKKLSSFDLAIQKVEKSIELLKEFKSSLISHVVTGKVKI